MSSEDQIRPYHAKTGSETADTLADVLEHAAAKDEAARKRSGPKKEPRWKMPVGVNLGVFAVYLLIGQPEWAVVNKIPPPDAAVVETNLRGAVYMVANSIEAFRIERGRLPRSLEEAGRAYPGLDYQVLSPGRYVLTAREGEVTLTYDSSEPLNDFLGDAAAGFLAG